MSDPPSADRTPEDLPFLGGLPAAARKTLLRKSISHSVAAGTVLIEQGDIPSFQHIVLKGSAHLFGLSMEGREVLIEIARPGDLLIPAAVVSGAPHLMQARILEPSRFLMIPADDFRAVLASESALAQAVIGSLADQFRRMVRQIKNLKLRNATQRVGCYVLALARAQQRHDVVLPYEKNLIASELGMTRESFSRALGALQEHGIDVRGDIIAINDMTRLTAASGPDPLIDEI